ncbi:PspA/IM30 family protein [Aneurinibacillus sp. Ricciae_BoGa-3]|uniref:PspA/IM30 family protein n=1 Tax=Aneurinibacillus sp. Ricciae_BoGa-3 TaxID=3022697 RepID=UPI00234041E9|nr:PspA/IM30 family protein [Aneurinibacillus sp. Ricciae_BoGa-3]WCK55269.1 PspA/IM30 family protein [Aneurinibacillus sp. Ricciae_BoGa-3]
MSIFKRVRDITMAAINEAMDHVEDPISMLNQYMRNMEDEISKAEQALARQIATEKKYSLYIAETKDTITKRIRQAELAVERGEDEMARLALSDKQLCEVRLQEFNQQYDTVLEQNKSLRQQLQELKDKYYEMKNKRTYLLSRANVAHTKQQINQVLRFDTESAASGFARMEEKIMALEAQAHAGHSILHPYNPASAYQQAKNEAVEQELARMKEDKKIG